MTGKTASQDRKRTASEILAAFSTGLAYDDIPQEVVELAKDTIIDTFAISAFGAKLPWGRYVRDYAREQSGPGPCGFIGSSSETVSTPYAALANGVFAHAFELDGARDPSVGTHPGAVLVPAILAAAEEVGADGKAGIAAFVAGCEVMVRVASATHHAGVSPEHLGFHAPSVAGPYGAAVAAGRLFGLNEAQMVNALGIAGSLSSGILAFADAKQGAMIKRLHLGRAAESGILAARLARLGYEGPETVLDGGHGLATAYAVKTDIPAFTAELGKFWETTRLAMKRYACVMAGQTSVQSMSELMREHGLTPQDVAHVEVEGPARIVTHNNVVAPREVMQGQYSIQYGIGLAMYHDAEDPQSWLDGLEDPCVLAACRLVTLKPLEGKYSNKASRVTVRLKSGKTLSKLAETFKGMPADRPSRTDLKRKLALCAAGTDIVPDALFAHLDRLETRERFSMRG